MVYPIAKKTLFPFVRFFINEVRGLENVPKKGPFIIACKHVGSLDGVFLASVVIPKLNQKIYFISNLAKWGWLWEKIISEKWAGAIPFDKQDRNKCLEVALEKLKQGKIVGIFPEGILQERLKKAMPQAKTGLARLAIWAKVPIIPVGLEYNINNSEGIKYMVNRWHVISHSLLHPKSISINIGQPFEVSEYYDRQLENGMLHEVTGKIIKKIESLTKITINN